MEPKAPCLPHTFLVRSSLIPLDGYCPGPGVSVTTLPPSAFFSLERNGTLTFFFCVFYVMVTKAGYKVLPGVAILAGTKSGGEWVSVSIKPWCCIAELLDTAGHESALERTKIFWIVVTRSRRRVLENKGVNKYINVLFVIIVFFHFRRRSSSRFLSVEHSR